VTVVVSMYTGWMQIIHLVSTCRAVFTRTLTPVASAALSWLTWHWMSWWQVVCFTLTVLIFVRNKSI